MEQFIREMKIQLYLSHPNIIKMYGYFDDDPNIFIILEVGTGGQLFHQLKRTEPMQEAKVAPIIKQLCDAVNEIHSLRIIHRDIKPENIVIHDVSIAPLRTSSSSATSAGPSTRTTSSGPPSAARPSTSAPRSSRGRSTTRRSTSGRWAS